MKLYKDINEFLASYSGKPTVATIGFFDGVHKGHQSILLGLRQRAQEIGGESILITFDEHPAKVLRPQSSAPVLLTSTSHKISLIESLGIDHLILIHFTRSIAEVDARTFITPLIEGGGLTDLILGYDNRFGRKTDMSLVDFDAHITSLGVHLQRMPSVAVDGMTVSSSLIRQLVAACDFARVETLLGRPYRFSGKVCHGQKIGRTMEYPTANIEPLDPDIYLPSVGIYIAEVCVRGVVYPSMAYYGGRPTVDGGGHALRLEAFLLDFSEDLYGQEVEIGFRHFLREDKKFDSLRELAEQLQQDEIATRKYFTEHPISHSYR